MKTLCLILALFISVSAFAQEAIEFYNRANAQLQYKNYDEAIALLTKAVLARNDFADAFALRGDCYYFVQDYPTAIENYLKDDGLKKNRSSYSLATCYSLTGNLDEAFKYLEANLGSEFKIRWSYIVADPNLEAMRKDSRWNSLSNKKWYSPSEAAMHEADEKSAANDLQGAIASETRAIELDSRNHKAYGARAILHIRMQNLDAALSDLNKAIALAPQSDYIGNRGYVYNNLGNAAQALADYERAVQIDPTNLVYYDLGMARYRNGKKAEALEALKKHTSYYTQDEMGQYFAGIVSADLKLFNESLGFLNRAIEINGGVHQFYMKRGDTYFQMKRVEDAVRDYNKVIEMAPDNGEAYYIRGNAKGTLLDKAGACEDWKKAVQLGFNDENNYIRDLCN